MSMITKLFSLDGKTAIITGASRGIGAVLAEGAAAAGATVIANARSDKPKTEFSNEVDYRQCDITDSHEFNRVCTSVVDDHGRLDILVNCAGIALPPDPDVGRPENFDRTIEVNLNAQYRCMAIAREKMAASGGGSIINICSLGSVFGMPGNPGYVASKGGLRMLTKAAAIDWAPDNIRVNNLIPGYIHTDGTHESFSDERLHQQRLDRMILPRWGRPEDHLAGVIFPTPEASAYVTGQDLFVDGGWTAKGLG